MNLEKVIELINSDEKKDLHIHSRYSDGVLEPVDILKRWAEEGKRIVAITDHDGIDGSVIGCEAAASYGVDIIPGIEFDSLDELGKDLHILGYGIDFDNEHLKKKLEIISGWRDERNQKLHQALVELGYDITTEEINSINDGIYVGKPTFARVLLKRGVIQAIGEAFDTIFKEPLIKRIEKHTLSSKEVVDLIHEAGGIAVLAHPMEQMRSRESFDSFEPRLLQLLDRFVEYGVDGIECTHPSASEKNSEYLKAYARAHGLLMTEGSDFHFDGIQRDYSRYQ